jgi:hypothetical protein
MAHISFAQSLRISQVAAVIPMLSATVEGEDGHITPILLSEPGVGKTSVLKLLEKQLGDEYDYIYVDCPCKDLMDIAATIPNHADKSLEQYVGALFKMDSPRKKVILLDEVFKTPKILAPLYTRAMLERVIGDRPLPLGSIVFGTSNNAGDGVGDFMQAHTGNRVCLVPVAKSNAKEWNVWAGENGISSILRGFVALNPRVMASHLDGGQDDNPYIFHPNRKGQYLSPRSLAKCNRVVKNYRTLGADESSVLLKGIIGTAAAEQLAVFIDMDEQIHRTSDILAAPETISVPTDNSALAMVMFNAVDDLTTQDELSLFMKFINRVPQREMQSLFFTMLMSTKRTVRMANNNDTIKLWASDNFKIIV